MCLVRVTFCEKNEITFLIKYRQTISENIHIDSDFSFVFVRHTISDNIHIDSDFSFVFVRMIFTLIVISLLTTNHKGNVFSPASKF